MEPQGDGYTLGLLDDLRAPCTKIDDSHYRMAAEQQLSPWQRFILVIAASNGRLILLHLSTSSSHRRPAAPTDEHTLCPSAPLPLCPSAPADKCPQSEVQSQPPFNRAEALESRLERISSAQIDGLAPLCLPTPVSL
jgi:hypothetical protein